MSGISNGRAEQGRSRYAHPALRPFALYFLLTQTLNAYEVPLHSESVREAYVLGQRNDRATADFVASYTQQITEMGIDGPHRVDIEILTPYSQVVDASDRMRAAIASDRPWGITVNAEMS
jgi:hypothetical protein